MLSKDNDGRIDIVDKGAAGLPLDQDGDTAAVVRRRQGERDGADGAGDYKWGTKIAIDDGCY